MNILTHGGTSHVFHVRGSIFSIYVNVERLHPLSWACDMQRALQYKNLTIDFGYCAYRTMFYAWI